MKTCAIIDEYMHAHTVLGYLLYYDQHDTYYIELDERIQPEGLPLLLSAFSRRRQYTIGREWSRRWVQQRIIPTDRQNLGMILRDNGLKSYNSFRLLMLGEGRCAQDDLSIRPVKPHQLPDWMLARKKKKVRFAVPLKDCRILAGFYDDTVRVISLKDQLINEERLRSVLADPARFCIFERAPGGNGIIWDDALSLSADTLYQSGILLPLGADELRGGIRQLISDTKTICRQYNCSRQYVSQLVKKGALQPASPDSGSISFWADDVRDCFEA